MNLQASTHHSVDVIAVTVGACERAKSHQSCLTLHNPVDLHCNLPGSPVHGILQARMLQWVAILFQGIFLTQGSNLSLLWLLHCRQILYH